MLIKTACTIGGVSMSRHSVKMSVVIPSINLPSSVSSLQLLGSSFTVGLASQGKKYKIQNVLFGGLSVDRDGESKIKLEIDPEDMGDITFTDLSDLKKQSVNIALKGGGNSNDA